MTLAQQIESLGALVAGSHDHEMQMIAQLAADIARREAELGRAVQALLVSHEQYRADVGHAVAALGARIGFVPLSVLPPSPPPPALPVQPKAALPDPLKIYPQKDVQQERAA